MKRNETQVETPAAPARFHFAKTPWSSVEPPEGVEPSTYACFDVAGQPSGTSIRAQIAVSEVGPSLSNPSGIATQREPGEANEVNWGLS